MRKVLATVLALPVLVLAYLVVVGRGGLARAGAGLAAAVVVGLVVAAALPPAASRALPAVATPEPVAARVLDSLATGHGLREPLRVTFDARMDPASVAAAMRLAPDAAVEFGWDEAGRVLTIRPVTAWQPDTLYVLTVDRVARSAEGGELDAPVRATVLTARPGTAEIQATSLSGSRARLDTAFRIVLDRPVPLEVIETALRFEPAVAGRLSAGETPTEFLFTPADRLAPDGRYAVSLSGLVDGDGVPFAAVAPLAVVTARAPSVVRFRPVDGTRRVERTAAISVRFTERMQRDRTAAALSVEADGKAIAGETSWAEEGTVLVFVPGAALPYGATVVARVGPAAASRAGAPLARGAEATFTVEPKPKPRPRPAPSGDGDPAKPIEKPGGGGAVAGNWAGVEAYYLDLMNCTRTGGWVSSEGTCKGAGSRDVAPLVMNAGISSKVARPYAKLLATRGICNHFIGGTPGDRLRRAGYTSYRWGENLGCRSGNPYSAVLGSHRYFQAEKPYNGGHYRNLMDARFRQAGIGVWVASGRVRLVVDFYTP